MKQLFVLLFLVSGIISAQNTSLTTDDLNALYGHWTGTLTYMDYNSGEPFSMPCNVDITKTKQANKLDIAYIYPKEPKANSTSKLILGDNGTTINKKPIVAVNRKDGGATEVYCEYQGRDGNDNKKATIRTYYTISDEEYKMTKFVQFEGTEEWIKRSEYVFKKAY